MFDLLLPLANVNADEVAEGFAGIFSLCCFGSLCLLGPLTLAFWIWMLVDVVTKEPSEGNERLVWLLVVILLGFLGALLYFFVRRPQRIRQFGR